MDSEADDQARPSKLSLKARLASVLLLASLPGVVLGMLEAHRAYSVASSAARQEVTQTAEQVANRSEEVMSGALILAQSLAQDAPVRIGSTSCNAILASAAGQSNRFAAISRVDRNGQILCSSASGAIGASLRDAPWFRPAMRINGPSIAPAWRASPSDEPVVPLSAPILYRDQTTGLVVVTLRGVWLITQAAQDLGSDTTSVVMFDSAGAPFAISARGADQQTILAAARRALARRTSPLDALQGGVATISGGGMRVVTVAPTSAGAIGLRAALIIAAPLVAVSFSIIAVWIALQWWAVRWIDRLVTSARSVLHDRYQPVDLVSAPMELRLLGAAVHDAVTKAGRRAIELSVELGRNNALTRELHHRVKNNIQVIMSGLSRQLRRTEDPTVRLALSEARARLLPIALAYRFAAKPEDVTQVDLAGYLGELARQIHDVLDGNSRGVELSVDCESIVAPIDNATTLGMLVCECLTTGYLSSSGMSSTHARVQLRRLEQQAELECGLQSANLPAGEAKFDEPLVSQLARQLEAEVTLAPGPFIRLRWPAAAPAAADAVLVSAEDSGG
jgi:two-component sensor histidine kinase